MRNISAGICILLAGLAAQTAHAQSTDIQMLPPTTVYNNGTPCSYSASNQILVLNGSGAPGSPSAINCDQLFTADPASGNVTITGNLALTGTTTLIGATTIGNGLWVTNGPVSITNGSLSVSNGNVAISNGSLTVGTNLTVNNSLMIGGSVTNPLSDSLYIGGVGPLTGADAQTLVNLTETPGCGPYSALSKDNQNKFSCVAITDIQGVGTAVLPNCTNGVLTWSGTAFGCVTLPTVTPSYWALNGSTLSNTAGSDVQINGNTVEIIANPVHIDGVDITNGQIGTSPYGAVTGLPPGSWGVHTYGVYAESEIAAGQGGVIAAYISAVDGSISAAGNISTAANVSAGGMIGIGTASPNSSLDLSNKTDAVIMPQGPTEPSPAVAGMTRFNTTTRKLEFFDGSAWVQIASTQPQIEQFSATLTGSSWPSPSATPNYLDCNPGEVAISCTSIESPSGQASCNTHSGMDPGTGYSACVQDGCGRWVSTDPGYKTTVNCAKF